MQIPAKPQAGRPIPLNWYLRLWMWIRGMAVSGSKYIRITRDTTGQSITLNFTKLQNDLYQAFLGAGGEATPLPMPIVDVTDYSANPIVYKIQVQTAYGKDASGTVIQDILEYPNGYYSLGWSSETELASRFVYYDFTYDGDTGIISGVPEINLQSALLDESYDIAEKIYHCFLGKAFLATGDTALTLRRRKFDNYLPIIGC
jgi:hypothetical protein